ncbi:fluoride efflux transporter CrcB [Ideonella sp. A 288]|uniref:fluoride efflux transporter CrcB n=1 Tax=Ideonella sp. A 288 TaxID=1962181 RepID=UPI001F209C50|nr:fluoride efflux transporter CrcB [Ideonella sp. A 288]
MSAAVTATQAVAVAVGAGLGALARWMTGLALNPRWGGFPLGTLLVNCLGGALIGVAMVWFQRSPHEVQRLFLVTGVLGGFTTFSAFSAESLGLIQRGDWGLALLHSGAHLLGALACTALGYHVARAVLRVA